MKLPIEGTGEQITIQKRRIDALELRQRGYSYRKIAKATGVSHVTAIRDVKQGLAKLDDLEKHNAETLRHELKARVHTVYNAIEKQVSKGDLKAIDRWLRAIQTEATLFGIASAPPVIHQNKIELVWSTATPPALPDNVITVENEAANGSSTD